jgi:hypothetical protein
MRVGGIPGAASKKLLCPLAGNFLRCVKIMLRMPRPQEIIA